MDRITQQVKAPEDASDPSVDYFPIVLGGQPDDRRRYVRRPRNPAGRRGARMVEGTGGPARDALGSGEQLVVAARLDSRCRPGSFFALGRLR